jgi:hypothetical protein
MITTQKSYRVHCYETVDAIVTVLAESEEDAKRKVEDMISEQGMPTEGSDLVQDVKVVNRDFLALCIVENKEN